ncbi:hypothetical protein GCM10010415_18580 [Streptomyces atrovirens]|uniref:Uncharacterized protein n=1 Tax=Streptomyces atrovirens TaxID=285556 RepID=A0ABW0E2I2_9ACTN
MEGTDGDTAGPGADGTQRLTQEIFQVLGVQQPPNRQFVEVAGLVSIAPAPFRRDLDHTAPIPRHAHRSTGARSHAIVSRPDRGRTRKWHGW